MEKGRRGSTAISHFGSSRDCSRSYFLTDALRASAGDSARTPMIEATGYGNERNVTIGELALTEVMMDRFWSQRYNSTGEMVGDGVTAGIPWAPLSERRTRCKA